MVPPCPCKRHASTRHRPSYPDNALRPPLLPLLCVQHSRRHRRRRYSPSPIPHVCTLISPGSGAVYSFDPVGSYEREACRAAGAASSLVQPFLDNQVSLIGTISPYPPTVSLATSPRALPRRQLSRDASQRFPLPRLAVYTRRGFAEWRSIFCPRTRRTLNASTLVQSLCHCPRSRTILAAAPFVLVGRTTLRENPRKDLYTGTSAIRPLADIVPVLVFWYIISHTLQIYFRNQTPAPGTSHPAHLPLAHVLSLVIDSFTSATERHIEVGLLHFSFHSA